MVSEKPQRVLLAFHISEALRDIVSGVTRYVKEQHRHWQVLCVGPSELAANFGGQRCDGAITLVPPNALKLIQRLHRSTKPVVNLLRNLHPTLPSVMSDDAAIGRMGAAYLQSLGFRRMGFVSLDTHWSRDREAGFTSAILAANLPAPATTRSLGVKDFRFISQAQSLKFLGRWVRELGPRVAVMAPSDLVARTLLSVCQAEGLDVPGDIAILGVDNFLTLCELSPVPLSSIAQDFARIGFEAALMLDHMMTRGIKRVAGPVMVPPAGLHTRASTNVLAFDDPLVVATLRAIHENAATGITMRELLRRVPLSRKWLDHRFKQVVGHTPTDEIRRSRMLVVRDLLVDTEMPLPQIALRCKFSFPENLIRAFRATYGMSPHAYRVKHRGIRR